MEIPLPFKNINLPAFSDQQNSQFYIENLKDYYNWKDQIEELIINKDKENNSRWFGKITGEDREKENKKEKTKKEKEAGTNKQKRKEEIIRNMEDA